MKYNLTILFGIILGFIFFLGALVYADTNGVWHRAEDVRVGTFGSDEVGFGGINLYYFNNSVTFIKNSNFENNISVGGVIETSVIKAKPGGNGNVVIQLG